MRCQNCNNENFDYEQYCHVCGTKLGSQSNPPNSDKKKYKHSDRDFILRLFVGLLFTFAFVLYQLRILGILKFP